MGSLRLILALIVVLYHARKMEAFPHVPGLPIPDGYEALSIFFMMSGFYMALVLTEKYPRGPGPTLLFYANRWLRIWPVYLAALGLLAIFVLKTGVICSMACVDVSYLQQLLLLLPTLWLGVIIFSNIFMLGLDWQWSARFDEQGLHYKAWPDSYNNGPLFTLITPAWSLATELVFYLLAPFLVRKWWIALAVMAASLAVHWHYGEARQLELFFFPPSVYALFMAGALAYHVTRRFPGWVHARRNQILALLWCFACWQLSHYLKPLDPTPPLGAHTYLKLIGFLPLMPVLFQLTARSRIDRFLADLSYPFFMFHGPIFVYSLWAPPVPEGWMLTTFIVVTSLLAGLVGWALVEYPVARWRERWTRLELEPYQRKATIN